MLWSEPVAHPYHSVGTLLVGLGRASTAPGLPSWCCFLASSLVFAAAEEEEEYSSSAACLACVADSST